MSYQQSELNRQAILDHLHAYPLKSANQIAIDAGLSRNGVQSCVKFMESRGEIEHIGKGKTTAYRALVKTTISAKQVIAEIQEKRRAKGVEVMASRCGKTSSPGYYSQRGGNWQAQAGQGGQGALRREVGIQSVMA